MEKEKMWNVKKIENGVRGTMGRQTKMQKEHEDNWKNK